MPVIMDLFALYDNPTLGAEVFWVLGFALAIS